MVIKMTYPYRYGLIRVYYSEINVRRGDGLVKMGRLLKRSHSSVALCDADVFRLKV